jgi:hypothetical protein
VLQDRSTGTGVITQGGGVAWSDSPDIFFVESDESVAAYRLRGDLSVEPVSSDAVTRKLLAVYGRFGQNKFGRGDFPWQRGLQHDVCGDTEATTSYGLFSYLRVKSTDGTFIVADDGGLLHLPGRQFHEVCLLDNCHELIFDDYNDIYLVDVAQRKLGWIAHGSKQVIAAPLYQRRLAEPKK